MHFYRTDKIYQPHFFILGTLHVLLLCVFHLLGTLVFNKTFSSFFIGKKNKGTFKGPIADRYTE